ncbi:MAG TPA: hypothetical protein VGI70_18265 [Polyangiales bacterium]|jgi:DNA-binding XRE family transcriptional regulator
MAGLKTLSEPDATNPLAESTFSRRLWAAYRRAGYTRASFAAALGIRRYATVLAWDRGALPDIATIMRACDLVGYTVEDLWYGLDERKVPTIEHSMSDGEIIALLDQLRATDEQARALGEWRATPAGRYARCTRSFVAGWLAAYATAREAGQPHVEAITAAANHARDQRTLHAALSKGVRPITPARVRARGEEILASTRREKVRRKR